MKGKLFSKYQGNVDFKYHCKFSYGYGYFYLSEKITEWNPANRNIMIICITLGLPL